MTDLVRLSIGCGPNKVEGFIGIDLLPGPAVDVVAKADKLPYKDNSVDEILAEHLIEHLAFFTFNKTMAEWTRVLKPGGKLTIECPDLLGLCKQFVEGNEYSRYWTTGNYWSTICQIYGHQMGPVEDVQFSQVHKSGYTEEHLRFVLDSLGYESIEKLVPQKGPPDACILRLQATKK